MTQQTDQKILLEVGSSGKLAYLPRSFRVSKTRFRPTAVDRHVVWFCKQLALSRSPDARTGDSGKRLLTCRADFRRIQQIDCTTGLIWCFLYPDLVEEQRLAVWLLGRSHRRINPRILMQHARACPVSVRREIVRALRRMDAYKFATEVARGEKDSRILALSAGIKRDFRRILSKWKVADEAAVSPPARSFELFVSLPNRPHRGKTSDWIRAFLEHIRLLLRGAR